MNAGVGVGVGGGGGGGIKEYNIYVYVLCLRFSNNSEKNVNNTYNERSLFLR